MNYEIIRIDLGGVNSYLVKLQTGFILIDTGGHLFMDKVFNNKRKILEDKLDENGCVPGTLKIIILTHGDNDHVANALYLSRKYEVKIVMHRDDVICVEKPSIEIFMQNQKYSSVIFMIIGMFMKNKIKKMASYTLKEFEPFSPDLPVEEGHDFYDIGFAAKVIHLPGHTSGSIGILTDEGDLFAGDTLSNMIKPGIAMNAADFSLLYESIKKLKSVKIRKIYPGHGKPFSQWPIG